MNNKIKIILMSMTVLAGISLMPATYANHDNSGESWTSSSQEVYCHSSLSNLNVTSTVTDSVCDIVVSSASDWTNAGNSTWTLTQSQSSTIDFKGVNKGSAGLVGEMINGDFFGIIYTARVEINTQYSYGDSTSDSNVYDIYTIVKHEMGHLPQMNHNNHSGDESTSVMRSGPEIGYAAQRTISSNDITALENKYS